MKTVGIIGLGYVGLPLARTFANAGVKVIGYDIDQTKIHLLNTGESYIKTVPSEVINSHVKNGLFTATYDSNDLKASDALIICVPTPLTESQAPHLAYVLDTAEMISGILVKGQVVVLESTTYPGTTREELLPILEKSGLTAGEDFFLAFSPEREDPGNKDFSTKNIPKLVGGLTNKCLEKALAIYRLAIDTVIPVASLEVAEAAKILENIYRAVNIALVNEMKVIFDKMGIDVWQVINAAKTKPFGYKAFYPGPGLGGHCIPIDPFYLSWKARKIGVSTRFIELAGEINSQMPEYVVSKVMDALNTNGKSLKGAKILVLGIAYKPDIDDLRESPALKIIDILQKKGAIVQYNDPHIPRIPKTRKYDFNLYSRDISSAMLTEYNAVLIITNHSSYDYAQIAKHASCIIDTRNSLGDGRSGVVKA